MARDDIDTSSVVAGLWSAAWQYRYRTILAVVLLVLAKVAGVVVPLVLKAIVDRFSHPESARATAGADTAPTIMLVLQNLAIAINEMCDMCDTLATAYPGTPPAELNSRVRGYLGYTRRLLDGRMTLAEHRRLLVVAGWLSLLAATTLIDLHRDHAAAAYLRTAAQLARETEYAEIATWCLETQAWQVLTAGDYRQAAGIARAARQVAPREGSAFIQATAQEGRAWARLGDLIAGQISMAFDATPTALPQAQSGAIRAIGAGTAARPLPGSQSPAPWCGRS